MIIKEADDKQPQISALQALAARSDCDADTRKRIDREIRNIQAGARGEAEAAYEMKVSYGPSRNWAVLHDLRIEHGGLVAQIDHLIINRFLEMWVCESKHFVEGVAINEHGEFSAYYGGRPYGVPSPIAQNAKHILLLQRLFNAGAVPLPSRLGFTIKPELHGLVLVSKNARISRPKAKVDGLDCIIKNDQVFATIDRDIDQGGPLLMARVIGVDTLEQLARAIAGLHRPIRFDWAARFGLPAVEAVTAPAAQPSGSVSEPAAANAKQKLVCHGCGVSIAYNVAKFCWFNKQKFGGRLYCMECQKAV